MPLDLKEMSFVDHLEELRWHIIRSIIAISVLTLVSFASMGWVFHEIILAPTRTDFWTYVKLCELAQLLGGIEGLCVDKIDFSLQSRELSGQFTMHLTASFVLGGIMAFPYVVWELWRFIKPGLKVTEQNATTGVVLFVSVLFISGILFGYYVVAPMSVNFLANYKLDESIANQFDITSYVSTICMLVLGTGLIFQLPAIIWGASKMGLVTPAFLRQYWRHAYAGIVVLAAIITPSPDPFSCIMVAIPLILLYELSIFLSANVYRSKKKAEAAASKL